MLYFHFNIHADIGSIESLKLTQYCNMYAVYDNGISFGRDLHAPGFGVMGQELWTTQPTRSLYTYPILSGLDQECHVRMITELETRGKYDLPSIVTNSEVS